MANIYKIMDQNVDDFDKILVKVIDDMLNQIAEKIKLIETTGGVVNFNQANMEYVTSLATDWVGVLRNSEYSKAGVDVIGKFDNLAMEFNAALPTHALPFKLTGADNTMLDAFKKMNLQQYNIVGTDALNAIQTSLIEGVTNSVPLKGLVDTVRASLDGKLTRYAKTYVLTSQRQYLQKVEDISAQNYEDAGVEFYWEYVGPNDDKTRPECEIGLGMGVVTTEQKEQFEAETEIRWNCRHEWQMVNPDRYAEKRNDDFKPLPKELINNG